MSRRSTFSIHMIVFRFCMQIKKMSDKNLARLKINNLILVWAYESFQKIGLPSNRKILE